MVLPVMVVRVGVVMTVRGSAVRLNGVRIEGCSHRVETSDTQQNLVGHLAVIGFDDAQTVEMSIEPGSDLCDLLGTGEVYLVEDQHVGKADLLELELHQRGYSGCAKTWSASTTQVTLSSLMRSRKLASLKVAKIPPGSATPLASSRMYSMASGRASKATTDSMRSSRIWQQTQPLDRLITLLSTPTTSSASILMEPKSLTRTPTRRP